jgi:ABC-type glycerol-3-phosphate transport system permease component
MQPPDFVTYFLNLVSCTLHFVNFNVYNTYSPHVMNCSLHLVASTFYAVNFTLYIITCTLLVAYTLNVVTGTQWVLITTYHIATYSTSIVCAVPGQVLIPTLRVLIHDCHLSKHTCAAVTCKIQLNVSKIRFLPRNFFKYIISYNNCFPQQLNYQNYKNIL